MAEVNFLEHHNKTHFKNTEGAGNICPATLPLAVDRSCDGNECDLCFEKP